MEKVPPRPKKTKGVKKEELLNLSKIELADRILQLEAHNEQLKNIISKNLATDESNFVRKKPFDFTKCHFRRILLRIMYFGWDYQGLAVQEDTTKTIEHHLFSALIKSCLVESRETSNYHRCGRTDKGVSAFGQVISISVRSKFPLEQQYTDISLNSEISYCKVLNKLLPKEIKAVAWMPIPVEKVDYSARFDCKRRQYKYYFPKSSLDINNMRDACSRLIGSHDFRHLCKMDVGNGVIEFRREVLKAEIVCVDDIDSRPTSMFCLVIEGNAFLWHQIRCIVGVLLLIGDGKEEPDIIDELLNIEKNPRKPQYHLALDIPLNLFKCNYDLEDYVNWVFDRDELKSLILHLQNEWTIHSIKTTMIKDALIQLEGFYKNGGSEIENAEKEMQREITSHTECLIQGVKPRVYTPLLKRVTCSSLEERIEHYKKKRRKIQNTEIVDDVKESEINV